jgi:alkanesulfonate monooxygenase SsuD/methylene tetrahydromethanopterin reductase-like flavin-dependent oxidoreductase (luciferase family)
MQYALQIPPFGPCANLTLLATLAAEAEEAGWEGFFLWDDITRTELVPVADPWIALAAIALRTRSMRLGSLVTPLARRRPWKVARETVTLDHLSQGRLIVGLGVGAGATEFDDLGEETSIQAHAAMLEEGLDILTGLWSGEPFHYAGVHYQIRHAQFLPRPLQSPRVPVWLGGTWPLKAPFRRAARWDGVFPMRRDLSYTDMLTPEEMQAMLRFTLDQRAQAGLVNQPFEVAFWGLSSGTDQEQDRALVQKYAEAGVTWWVETLVPERWGTWTDWPLEAMRQRIQQGPPRIVEQR